jgi:hypothetical protein
MAEVHGRRTFLRLAATAGGAGLLSSCSPGGGTSAAGATAAGAASSAGAIAASAARAPVRPAGPPG